MRISVNQIREKKTKSEPLVMLTCYDYSTARILDDAGIELLLVGDSLGTVMLGYESTIPVTMDDMVHHTKAVVRGSKKAMVVADMPFLSYQVNREEALYNAGRLIQEGGAGAVKMEGGENIASIIKSITSAGIPVMAHLGLTPQYIHALGGYRIQGKSIDSAVRLYQDALAVEQAGAFALVLETVPTLVAAHISKVIKIPTIGIGAGAGCDGQVQVVHDILGSFLDFKPKHARCYANLAKTITEAVTTYRDNVISHDFPGDEESFTIDREVYEEFKRRIS
ncbi:MAG: 3-methyl-2-oxobutanoate hydroxymethyltransferase [Dehalococcoidales bacterium]|nr:3-methyl-2-oxobutanoate hydroxymethyltransferase [Dehalococcoidales bacterium]